MKRGTIPSFILLIGFILFSFNSLNAQTSGLQWNTFLGSSSYDEGHGIAADSSGNVFVTGASSASWGSPVNTYQGGGDAFVAKLDSSGSLIWNTFLGSISNSDYGRGIDLDSSGNIYVTGGSFATWGSPLNAHSGGIDSFVAKLDSSGNLVWNTFLGSGSTDQGYDIGLDSSGNVYVTGYSKASWGTPVSAHSGDYDTFVARLDSSGNLVWNTFLGSADEDEGRGISVDGPGTVYVCGFSKAAWGTPVIPFGGEWDAFVARLDSSGNLVWNTFLGSSSYDYGNDITMDSGGNIYVTGWSFYSWGTPIVAHHGQGLEDAFVAKLNSSGNLVWNTFIGTGNSDDSTGIVLNSTGNIYVTGYSFTSWGSPINPFNNPGYRDVFVAGLDSSGNLSWNTFMGCTLYENSGDIAMGGNGNLYVIGDSYDTWGTPVNAHTGTNWDVFVAGITPPPPPDPGITANGSEGPISITQSDSLQVRVSLESFGSSGNVDYWLAYKGPSGWIHYNNITKKWEAGLGVTHQGPLMDLNNKKVFQSSGLTPGNYTFYFGVDLDMNGKVTKSSLYKDEVQVTVTSN